MLYCKGMVGLFIQNIRGSKILKKVNDIFDIILSMLLFVMSNPASLRNMDGSTQMLDRA